MKKNRNVYLISIIVMLVIISGLVGAFLIPLRKDFHAVSATFINESRTLQTKLKTQKKILKTLRVPAKNKIKIIPTQDPFRVSRRIRKSGQKNTVRQRLKHEILEHYHLRGIMKTGDQRTAFIENQDTHEMLIVKTGEGVENNPVLKISDSFVLLRVDQHRVKLQIEESP